MAGLRRQVASIVLTFLAGMEVDPAYMRRRLGASVGIGVVSDAERERRIDRRLAYAESEEYV
jgi:hypothetical protein